MEAANNCRGDTFVRADILLFYRKIVDQIFIIYKSIYYIIVCSSTRFVGKFDKNYKNTIILLT